MNIYEKYVNLKNQKSKIAAQMLELEAQMYTLHIEKITEKGLGCASVSDRGFKFKCTSKETVKIDMDKMADLPDNLLHVFRHTPKLDREKYNQLVQAEQKLVDKCITTKPAKPSFSVEAE